MSGILSGLHDSGAAQTRRIRYTGTMTPPVQHAAGIILWRPVQEERRYLLLRNRDHGTWGFPKGHREAGESDIECARREVLEETGLSEYEIDPGFEETMSYPVHQGDTVYTKTVRYFLARSDQGALALSQEHSEGDWYPYDQALRLLQHEESRNLLSAAETLVMLDES